MKARVLFGVFGFAFVLLALYVFPPIVLELVVAALCVFATYEVLGEIGDLSFSVIKRQTGIKDYGHIFPGHGGVLDRFDSVLFVAPFAELLFRVIW